VEDLPGEPMDNVRDHVRIGPMPSLGTYPLCNRLGGESIEASPKSKRLRSQRRTAGFRYCGDVIGAVVQQFIEATSNFYTYRLSESFWRYADIDQTSRLSPSRSYMSENAWVRPNTWSLGGHGVCTLRSR
jgi:hypothetical protein